MAEEYRLKTMETTGPKPPPLYIKKPVISQIPYLRRIFPNPYLFIKPSTLMTQCDFFIYPYIGDLSHDCYQSFSREITCVPTVHLPYSFLSEPTSPTGLLNRCWSPLGLGTRSYRVTADFFGVGRDRPLPYVLA